MPQKLKLTVHGTGSDLLEIREVPDNLKIAKDARFSLEAMAPAPAGLKYVWLTSKDKVLAVSEQDGPNGKVLVECLGAGISEMQLQIHPAEPTNAPPLIDRRYIVEVIETVATELRITSQGIEPLGAET